MRHCPVCGSNCAQEKYLLKAFTFDKIIFRTTYNAVDELKTANGIN